MTMCRQLRQLVASLALVAPGCAADQMRFTATRIAARVPEVYQTQVMENLARTAANPGSMPYLSRVFNGTASATYNASLVASLTGQPHAFTIVNSGLSSFSRGVQANIGIDPIDNPDKLAAMQIAYREVVAPLTVTPEIHDSCLGYLLTDMNPCVGSMPPPGWLQIGRKLDVPRGAAAVAHCGATYVWVMPQDLDALTRFTYFILNVATVSSRGNSRPALPRTSTARPC